MSKMLYSEAEYSIYSKRAKNFCEELADQVQAYMNVLDFIMEHAVKDEAIRAKLLKLKSDVALYPASLENLGKEISGILGKMGSTMERTDKMTLPDAEEGLFATLFAAFK